MKFISTVSTKNKKSLDEYLFCSFAFNYHDSSVSFALGKKVVLVLEAERIFKEKKKSCTVEEMEILIKHGLNNLGMKIEEVDYWSMTTFNNPFISQDDIVDSKKKSILDPYFKKINFFGLNKDVLLTNHHLSHAGIYFSTEFNNTLVISCDGGGDIDPNTSTNECIAVFKGEKDLLTKQLISLDDCITGKTYGLCSSFVFGSPLHNKNSPEGKLMALASLGTVREKYYNFLDNNFKKIEKADYSNVMDILEYGELADLKGQALKETQDSKDFAATVHSFFIEKRLKDIEQIYNHVGKGVNSLILTGGASLNLDLNSRILNKYPNLNHFIAPCCDDTGQSLGSLCILINHVLHQRPIVNLPYLGEGVDQFDYDDTTLDKIVDIIVNNGIIILHNGKSEIGPRALGNRSFIARPDSNIVKIKLSEEIKQREWYRPIAPIVLEDKVSEYFTGPINSPFMLYRYEVTESEKHKLIGAIHIDNSARVQTVNFSQNKFLYDLIKKFGDRTGIYSVLNTSLNLKGDPLANIFEDSLFIYKKIDGPKGLVYDGKLILISGMDR